MTDKLDQYAVIGNPIGHSKSPMIHALFAEQTGQRLEYKALLAEPGKFKTAVDEFRAAGGLGMNVTVPFKQDAWIYADELSARAERAGAVNTLWFRENSVFGENTDGLGLLHDLVDNQGFAIGGKRILVLGAGGAARGVLQPLLAAEPDSLVIVNRTADKAAELALKFTDLGRVSGGGFDFLRDRQFDLLINATAASLSDELPAVSPELLAADAWCYDMSYGDQATAFVRWARQHGVAKALDGLGMLVEQAAASFALWRGVRPATAEVIAALRTS
jgi:shikimate dehydrogenase